MIAQCQEKLKRTKIEFSVFSISDWFPAKLNCETSSPENFDVFQNFRSVNKSCFFFCPLVHIFHHDPDSIISGVHRFRLTTPCCPGAKGGPSVKRDRDFKAEWNQIQGFVGKEVKWRRGGVNKEWQAWPSELQQEHTQMENIRPPFQHKDGWIIR